MTSRASLRTTLSKILTLPLLFALTQALNSENKLVQVWDSIEFYTEGTQVF